MKVNRKLKLTFIISERETASKLINYLDENSFYEYLLLYAKGSASSNILDYLGIGETQKDLIVYPVSEDSAKLIMDKLKNSEFIKKIIAFTIPVKGISSLDALKHFIKEEDNCE